MYNLKQMSDLPHSNNPSAPHADITNAPYLFGDPFGDADDDDYGDADDYSDDYGDADYGDADYGDPDMLAMFSDLSGDPRSRRRKLAIPLAAAGGFGAGVAGSALYRAAKMKAAKRRSTQARLAALKRQNTIGRQAAIRRNAGGISKSSMLNYFSLKGAKMNSSPIDPLSRFVADELKVQLDRQASDTPFFQETAIGTYAGTTWTCATTGVAANRLFTGLFLQFGTNALNASPGTVITITATIPLFNGGSLTIASTPFIFTYGSKFYVNFLFYPYTLVSNKPVLTLGQYNNGAPITVTLTGLPAASSVNLIVPGSLHPWTIAMRNSFNR